MKKPPKCDLILVTHGHGDHMGDVVSVARDSGAPVVAAYELCEWLRRKGIAAVLPMNKGGSQQVGGLRITMTDARHSSGYIRQRPDDLHGRGGRLCGAAGGRNGAVLRRRHVALRRHAIHRRDAPVPTSRFYQSATGSPWTPPRRRRRASCSAYDMAVPMHWGTFPLLTGMPADFRKLVEPKACRCWS